MSNINRVIWLIGILIAMFSTALLIIWSEFHIVICLAGLVSIFIFSRIISHKISTNLPFIFFCIGTVLISLTTFRLGGKLFNASDLFYLLSALLLCFQVVINKAYLHKIFIEDNPLLIPLCLFLFGAVLSMLNSTDPQNAIIMVGKYIFLFGIWLPVGISLLHSITKIKWFYFSIIVASLFPISLCISDYFFHTRLTSMFNTLLNLNLRSTVPIYGRFGTIMDHPNNFGVLLCVTFPIALWVLFYFAKGTFGRLLGLLYTSAILVCCLITGSRSVLLAVLVECLLMPYLAIGKIKEKAIIISVIVVIMIGFHLSSKYFPQSSFSRMSAMMSIGLGRYSADIDRVVSLKCAWNYIKNRPIRGIGVEHTTAHLTKDLYVHNTIFRLWASIGIFGLIASLWFYGKPIMTGFHLQKAFLESQELEKRNMTMAMVVATIGWIVFDMFQPQFHNRIKWITVVVLFAFSYIEKRNLDNLTFCTKCPKNLI